MDVTFDNFVSICLLSIVVSLRYLGTTSIIWPCLFFLREDESEGRNGIGFLNEAIDSWNKCLTPIRSFIILVKCKLFYIISMYMYM